MAAETKKEIELDIGHVLFIDIVGYSKLLITEQLEYLGSLCEIATPVFPFFDIVEFGARPIIVA